MWAAKNGLWVPRGVLFDAVGAGTAGTLSNTGSVSETHVIGASANAVIAVVQWAVVTSDTPTVSGTCGGTPMTNLLSGDSGGVYTFYVSTDNYYSLAVFGLLNPPTGSKTIAFNVSVAAATSYVTVGSVSYCNVASFGTPQANAGTSGTSSLAMTSTPSHLGKCVQGFSYYTGASSDTFTSYNQTQRYLSPSSPVSNPLLIGDAPGNGATVDFSAINSLGSTPFGGIGIPLLAVLK